jgi:hypothetical protein
MIRILQIFLALSVVFIGWRHFTPPQKTLTWQEDIRGAQQEAKKTGKPLLLFFTSHT